MDAYQLKRLAVHREHIELAQVQIKEAQAELDQDPRVLAITQAKKHLQEYILKTDELTKEIKEDALNEYLATQQKPTLAGLIFKMNHPLEYDIAAAESWAKEKMPELYKFDVSGFEKYAKAVQDTIPVPCVKIKDEPCIQLASDLSDYLP